MSGRYRLKKQTKKLNTLKQDEVLYIPGLLGIKIGGSKKVEVPDRPGFVYVRLRSDLSETIKAYNDKVAVVYDLPVIVVRDSTNRNYYSVHSKDTGIYNNWGSTAYLPRHGAQHSFDPNSPGADMVWVWDNQFMQFAPIPSGSNGSLNLIIEPGVFYSERYDRWIYAGNTGTPSFSSYKPTGSSARAVLCYIDFDGNPQLEPGNHFSVTATGTRDVLGQLPIMPGDIEIPICAVRLLSGTSSIVWDNLYNLRQFSNGYNLCSCTGSSGGGGSGASTFLELLDTPASYAGAANFFVRVNGTADALVFVSGTSSGGTGTVTVGANEVAFGDDVGDITSDQYFKVYTGDGYPSLVIGGVGDVFNDFETRNISLIDRGTPGVSSLGMYAYGAGYPSISMFKSRGTESSPSGAAKGNTLGVLEFGGTWGGSGDFLSSSAYIRGVADENFSGDSGGAYLQFWVTITGSSLPWSSMMDIHYNKIDMTGTVHCYSDKLLIDGDLVIGGNLYLSGSSYAIDHGQTTGKSDDDHTQYAITAPGSSTRNLIQPTNAAYIPLTVKAAASQTADLQQWQISSGAVRCAIDKQGFMYLGSIASQSDVNAFSVFHGFNTASTVQGLNFTVYQSGAGSVYGIIGTSVIRGGSNISTLAGSNASIGSHSLSTGSVTNATTYLATSPIWSGGGSVTNLYGLWIQALTGKATTTYGIRVHDGLVVFNDDGNATSDMRVEGDNDANLLFTDASEDKVGIGTNTPSSKLDVVGDVEIGDANAFYLGPPTTDGTWRFIRSGNDLVIERREGGSYVTKSTISA